MCGRPARYARRRTTLDSPPSPTSPAAYSCQKKRQNMHRPLTYPTRHAIPLRRQGSTQLQLSCRSLTPIRSRACQHRHSQPRKFGWREVVGIPRYRLPRTSASVCGQPNARRKTPDANLKCPKRGRTPQRVFYRPNAGLNGTVGGRKTQRKVDNAQCGVDRINARSNGPNASADG